MTSHEADALIKRLHPVIEHVRRTLHVDKWQAITIAASLAVLQCAGLDDHADDD